MVNQIIDRINMTEEKDRRLKILWNSNSPHTNSGYASFTRDFVKRAKADGWQIAINAFVGHEGSPREIDGILNYPRLADTWGSDGLVYNGRHFGAHVVVHFADSWVLNPQFLAQLNAEGRKLIYYVPIDQEPIPPNVIQNLKFGYKLISFSKFGQKALQKAGYTSKLIVEGVDTDIFKPLDKKQCRKELGLPENAFIIGQIGANKENLPRKGWQQSLEAFKLFHDKHPEAIFFYQTNQQQPSGFPIMHYANYLGIDKHIFHLDDYMSTFHAGSEIMVKIYNSFDFLTHASLSEGFGLCIIEAQACGILPVVNRAQSQPELVIPEETGYICEPGFKWFSNAGGFHFVPDTKSLYEQYEKIYALGEKGREAKGKKAREYVMKNYNINTLYENEWKPLLEKLQIEILGGQPSNT